MAEIDKKKSVNIEYEILKHKLRQQIKARNVDLDKFDEIDRDLYLKLNSEDFQDKIKKD